MKIEDAEQVLGWNVGETLKRFSGNRMLYRRFLQKFPSDQTFLKLKDAVASQDFPAVETTAHTLKGVAGNLGFSLLFEKSAELVDVVRNGETDHVPSLFADVETEYQRVINGISAIEWE